MVLDPTKETVMSGWADGIARLAIKGKLKGGLVVHRTVSASGWTVSHIGSGNFIAAFEVEFNAYAFAENLLNLADWEVIEGQEDLSSELRAEVRAAAAAFDDCSLNA